MNASRGRFPVVARKAIRTMTRRKHTHHDTASGQAHIDDSPKAHPNSEQRLATILEGFPIPTFVVDSHHKVTNWNRAMEEMSGIKAHKIIGTNQHWRAFYAQERPCLADLLIDERVQEIPHWYTGKFNKSHLIRDAYEATDFFTALGSGGKWLRFTAALLRDQDGKILGAIETLEDITDRRLAQKALKESETRLKTMLEGSPIPTFVIGLDHTVLYWNKALEEMSGIRGEEIIGTNQQWRAFYAKERPCMADLLVDNILDDIPQWYVGKYRKSHLIDEAYEATDFFPALGEDGKWLRFTAAALRDSEGILFGAVETLEDITERKKADEALRESEQRLKTTLEGSPIAAFIIGKDHRVIYWNKALEKLSGIKVNDAIGTRKHWEAFYNHERPCMADLLVDELLDEIPPWYKNKYRKSNLIANAFEAIDFFPALGREGRWLRFTAAPLRDSKGIIFGAIETLEDITERKKTDKALRESEEQLKSILEGSPIPAYFIGKDHRIIYWNKALEKLSGIPPETALGTRKHWEVFYDNERPCMADLLVDELLDEIPPWYSERYQKSELIDDAFESTDFFPAIGNEGRWLRFTAKAVRDSQDILFGAIETIEDITAIKLAEMALKEKEKKYLELSITDGLTSLYNLRYFYSQVRSEIDRANRYKHPLSIMLLDLDDFKQYNDTYGHLEGDKVLMRLGQVIRRCLRKTDTGFRYGGEEFTLLLPDTEGNAATALAERIRREFRNEVFSPQAAVTVQKTVSIGVSQYISGEELSNLLKRVDASMYRAKEAGKDCVCFSKSDDEMEHHPAHTKNGID